MTVVTTIDTGSEPFERPDLTRVKPAHARLMRAYVGVLAKASQFGWPIQGQRKEKSFASGLVVRWLVGSHIKRNLVVLGNIYLQLEQTFTCDDSDPIDSWLPKVREGSLAAAEPLPHLRLPGILGLVSAAVALFGLLSKLPGWIGDIFLGLAIGLAFNLWGLYAILRSSYLYKRSLFLGDAKRIDKKKKEEQKAVLENNIYALEDELFGLLHRGKKREAEIDKWLFLASSTLVLYGVVGIAIWRIDWNANGGSSFITLSAVTVAACVVYAVVLWWRTKRIMRTWL